MSIAYSKKDLRQFWTITWRYMTTDVWASLLHVAYYKSILLKAVDKLFYENQFTEQEACSIKNMLNSDDKESHYTAVIIMALKKPKKFRKI